MAGALKARVGGAWTYVKGIKGDKGDPGPPSVGLTTLTSNYDQTIRQTGPTGGPFTLLFRRNKEAYLNDRNDIDATGATDMGATITTYLSQFAAAGIRHVYSDPGSVYTTTTTITQPSYLHWQGGFGSPSQGEAANQRAEIRAGASGISLVKLSSKASLDGMYLSLGNPTYTGNRAIWLDLSVLPVIEHCLFGVADATSTGIYGGGNLYVAIRDCVWSNGFNGRGIDQLKSYCSNPGAVYYGINVGWIERCLLGAAAGGVRVEGIITVRDSDFEAAYTNPALEIATPSANSTATIDGNYFEITGASQAILLGAGCAATVTNNYLTGHQSTVGGYGLKGAGIVYAFRLDRNTFANFETGAILPSATDTNWTGYAIGNNTYSLCTTTTTGGPDPRNQQSWTSMTQNLATALMQKGDGRITYHGALAGGAGQVYNSSGSVIDLRAGNSFRIIAGAASTLTAANPTYGQMISLINQSGGPITLPNATWHPIEGLDITIQHGEARLFVVDYGLVIREVARMAKPPVTKTAAFTADASADTYLCDATTAAFTATLPSAATWTGGPLTVKKTDSSANAVTIGTTSSQTIDGATTLALTAQYAAITVRPSGSSWFIVNKV